MGLQDRDYWRERYDERMGEQKSDQSQGQEKLRKMKFFEEEGGSGSDGRLPSDPVLAQPKPKKSATFMNKFLWVMGFVIGTCIYFGYLRADFLRWLAN